MLSHRTPLTILALLVVLQSGATARSEDKTLAVPDNFVSGKRTIRVERFEPAAKGKYPVVIFLYGVDGIHRGNATAFRSVARRQADCGFVVLIVHYLDVTENYEEGIPEMLKELRKFLLQEKGHKKEKVIPEYFAAWKEVVKDALKHARKQEKADGERVALVGLSLGGFLATAVSSEPKQNVAAVVTLFGGIPPELANKLRWFPPAMIVSGDKDDVVPHQESLKLQDQLKKMNVQEQTKIHKGVGHCFKNGRGAALETLGLLTVFLDTHLVRKAQKNPMANLVDPRCRTDTRRP